MLTVLVDLFRRDSAATFVVVIPAARAKDAAQGAGVKQDQVEQLRQRRDRDERLQCPLQRVNILVNK